MKMSGIECKNSIEMGESGEQIPKERSASVLIILKKNRIMRVLLLILSMLIVALIVINIFIAVFSRKGYKIVDSEVCMSKDCITTAKYLFANMNFAIDPCEDFYNFSCGNWGVNNPRPFGEEEWGVSSLVSKDLNEKIRVLLENVGKEKVPLAVQKAQNFYSACTNVEFREEYGREQLTKVLKKIGGLPMLSNQWNLDKFNWEDVYIYGDLHLNSLRSFFNYDIRRLNPKDIKNVIELKMPESFYIAPALNDSFLNDVQKEEKKKIFIDMVVKVMKELKSELSTEEIKKDVEDIIDLERKIYTLCELSDRLDPEQYFKLTITTLDNKTDSMNYTKIFNGIFNSVNITIPENEELWTKNPRFFQNIGKIIAATSFRTLANYMGYSIVLGYGRKVIPYFNLDKIVPDVELKETCVSSTEEFFPVAVNYWFVKKYYGNEMVQQVSEYLVEVKNSLTLNIQTNKWMDDDTRLEAQRKLNAMMAFVAVSQNMKTDKDLDDYYSDTGFISSENYPYSYKKMSKWIKKDQLRKLREIGKKEIMTPSTVNAFYSHSENKIKILTGFLTPPNFYPNAPVSINMAAIGSTIGHEITHGFDDTGSQFDHKGYQKNWWGDNTFLKFEEKVNCFVEQYSNFTEPKSGLKINGKRTVGENIADNGAVRQAFIAYKMYANLKNPEANLRLPLAMSKFTRDQLFFISYANTFCNDHSKSYYYKTMFIDEHAPDTSRVVVPLQNSPEFSKAFNCKLGSHMNQENKCLLW